MRKQTIIILNSLFIFFQCTQTDNFDIPPIQVPQGIEAKITLTEFLQKYGNPPAPTYINDLNAVFEAYVVSGNTGGNIPYTIHLQENKNGGPGIKIPVDMFNYSADYPIGCKIIINANGLYIGEINNALTLGSGQGNFWSITKAQAPAHLIPTRVYLKDSVQTPLIETMPKENILTPKTVSIKEINDGKMKNYVGSLIKLINVSFTNQYIRQSYVVDDTSRNIKVTDGEHEIDMRVENSAEFSNQIIPPGKGVMVAVLDKYKDTYQLRIRDLRDVFLSTENITKVQFSVSDMTVNGEETYAYLQVDITDPSDTTTKVDVVLVSGEAALIGDYSTKTLNFVSNSNTPQQVKIPIPSGLTENKTFQFSLQNISGGNKASIGAIKTLALTVLKTNIPQEEELILSEYIEGSSDNKYIEIKNVGTKEANLSLYNVSLYANGNTTASKTQILSALIDGPLVLPPGDVLILKNSAASLELPTGEKAYNSSVVNYNGDDVLLLKKEEITIDAIGKLGVDPGNGWSVAGILNATIDHGIRRKNTIEKGNPDWDISAGTTESNSEWLVVDIKDDISHLGK